MKPSASILLLLLFIHPALISTSTSSPPNEITSYTNTGRFFKLLKNIRAFNNKVDDNISTYNEFLYAQRVSKRRKIDPSIFNVFESDILLLDEYLKKIEAQVGEIVIIDPKKELTFDFNPSTIDSRVRGYSSFASAYKRSVEQNGSILANRIELVNIDVRMLKGQNRMILDYERALEKLVIPGTSIDMFIYSKIRGLQDNIRPRIRDIAKTLESKISEAEVLSKKIKAKWEIAASNLRQMYNEDITTLDREKDKIDRQIENIKEEISLKEYSIEKLIQDIESLSILKRTASLYATRIGNLEEIHAKNLRIVRRYRKKLSYLESDSYENTYNLCPNAEYKYPYSECTHSEAKRKFDLERKNKIESTRKKISKKQINIDNEKRELSRLGEELDQVNRRIIALGEPFTALIKAKGEKSELEKDLRKVIESPYKNKVESYLLIMNQIDL